ncbi:MAG: tRNA epoxyqueuosine(34) reductase QueG [Myxococcota bacterium]|nr:tRNA epoxyqueuosine(34) reductase QueG [Myxococcota bacterium]
MGNLNANPPTNNLAERIRTEAAALGFSRVRFARTGGAPGIGRYDDFLAAGHHGQMTWMQSGREARAAPLSLLPTAKTAVVLGVDYAWPRPPDPGGLTGKVSCYAWGRDYHNLMSKRLRRLARGLREDGVEVYWGVDSRPLIERAWAARSGMGFVGKNCMVIIPGTSSYLFLAVMLISEALPEDPPTLRDHCGTCRRCLEVCPTDAFVGPMQLDARRCIAYLTIEHRGAIPLPLRPLMGRWVFGCDLCQEVCPHNHRLHSSPDRSSSHDDFQPRTGHAWLDLQWLLTAEDDDINAALIGSPLRRPKPAGLKRNAAVVAGNLGDVAARPALLKALQHSDEHVASHARWALDRL